jgi:hypothetical protein
MYVSGAGTGTGALTGGTDKISSSISSSGSTDKVAGECRVEVQVSRSSWSGWNYHMTTPARWFRCVYLHSGPMRMLDSTCWGLMITRIHLSLWHSTGGARPCCSTAACCSKLRSNAALLHLQVVVWPALVLVLALTVGVGAAIVDWVIYQIIWLSVRIGNTLACNTTYLAHLQACGAVQCHRLHVDPQQQHVPVVCILSINMPAAFPVLPSVSFCQGALTRLLPGEAPTGSLVSEGQC